MIRIISIIFVVMSSIHAHGNEPNFKCSLAGTSTSGTISGGFLTLTGSNPMEQSYQLQIVEGQNNPREFTGTVYIQGSVAFSSLPNQAQEDIKSAIVRRPQLSTGNLLSFSNSRNPSEGTLRIFLMPSGQIAFLQIGALEALCY